MLVALFSFKLVLSGIALALTEAATPLTTVTLDYGTFTGLRNATSGITSFLGMRFADPPIGALRWRAPVSPPSTHLGNVSATALGFACIGTTQHDSGATTDEDCLFGNVYVPTNTTATSNLPVLVFFHGGGFETGRTRDAPAEHILQASKKPFVFATFEYRLGQFGFLAGTPVHQSGQLNAGLLDQRAALEWVQRYISRFGGDPTRVTIWGQSAGAGSVMYHLIAEGGQNQNLFHQAMGDSPPMLYLPHYTDAFIEDLFMQFAGLAKCANSGNGPAIMACLRAASTKTIATAGSSTLVNLTSSLFPFGPIADGSFILERPVEAFQNGHFIKVPVLFGSNTDEGANWSAELPNPAANTSTPGATETTVYNFLHGQYATLTKGTFDDAVKLYPLSDYSNSMSLQGQQMYGEMRYICSALMVGAKLHDAGQRTFQYHWDNPTLGSTHGDELDALFNFNTAAAASSDPNDAAVVTAMREYFTSFATDGVPSVGASSTDGDGKDGQSGSSSQGGSGGKRSSGDGANQGGSGGQSGSDGQSSSGGGGGSDSQGGSGDQAVQWQESGTNGSPRILLHPGQIRMENVDSALRGRCDFWHKSNVVTELAT
ncbi:Alpha/Beta hydrolase protein [Mycena pura]|uniref:Carboxylic ester hydrolase n=1 Tax=Mycena pura TaxID=153505 RepID=A0AAD6UZ59_9AGAR|nr:Alpha/Beta hydrolase protein [Mycena pura]